MLQKALVLVFVVASIASCISCGTTSSHYLYATIPAVNQVKAYREDPNSGVLTEIQGSPYPVGVGANSVVIHPSGKYLYVANPGQLENDISLFDIASNGTLTEITPRTPVGSSASQPAYLAMDPTGGYLYVANIGSDNISVFSIDSSSGALTQVPNSPFGVGLPPANIQVTPSGNYLYVTATGGQVGNDGSIVAFSASAGVLTNLGTVSSTGFNPNGLAIDPSGSTLYVANTGSGTIAVFSISATGTPPGSLTLSATISTSPNIAPVSLIFDPAGAYLYVADQGSSNVAVYLIDSTTGLPTLATVGPFVTQGGSPSVLAVDPTGEYLYVANQGTSAGIQAFSLSSGNLTSIYSYHVGNTPSSMAVLK
jgi:6-phosphogluconolactonase (cycloisomerase 2 family)